MASILPKPTFTMTEFRPIGLRIPNYPVTNCATCRGLLIDVCGECEEKASETCNVVTIDNNYHHDHCYKIFQANQVK